MPRQNIRFFRSENKAIPEDDASIVRICLTEDSNAFENIVAKYRNQVFWTAYHLVLDFEDARDITQVAFLKAWKSLAEYDVHRPFSAWISRITANCAIDFLRKRKHPEPLAEVPTSYEGFDRKLDMRKIFDRVAPLLAERQRMVLVLREIEGMEYSEIATLLDCTESTVRNLLSQARESFRKKVKEIYPEYGM